jgi:hypothetical protein
VPRPGSDVRDEVLGAGGWTRSEQFRKAHGRAPGTKPLYLGHPQFEGFESIQTLARPQNEQAA